MNIAKIDIGKMLRGTLAAPDWREMLGGILLYTAAGFIVYDTLNAWWLNIAMPSWHWALYVPVIVLAVWLLESRT